MTIYYDSSALLKIYINEENSDFIRQSISKNQLNFISTLSYIEIHSVFSRLVNNTQISQEELSFLKASFNNDFKIFQQISIDNRILKRSAELTYLTNLRTLDSIHLATIEYLKSTSDEEIKFACFDNKLIEGAVSLGINILKP
jgi:predicted nucleic acid-binding protein